MRAILGLFVITLLSGCEPKTTAPQQKVTNVAPTTAPVTGLAAADVVATYKTMRLMTPNSVDISSKLFLQCAIVTAAQSAPVAAKYGPHAADAINIYMNDSAAKGLETTVADFPVGAVIVKEKTLHHALGGMIKRAPGYDTDHDNWEFFFAEKDKPLATGKLQSCIECHDAAASTDHVYGSWAAK